MRGKTNKSTHTLSYTNVCSLEFVNLFQIIPLENFLRLCYIKRTHIYAHIYRTTSNRRQLEIFWSHLVWLFKNFVDYKFACFAKGFSSIKNGYYCWSPTSVCECVCVSLVGFCLTCFCFAILNEFTCSHFSVLFGLKIPFHC